MKVSFLIAGLWSWSTIAFAQVAITTFGSTDASQCYEDARNQFTNDESSCDRALKNKRQLSTKDYLGTLVNRGIIRNRNSNLNGAISDFNSALALNDRLAEAYLNRGNSYFFASRFDDALADYNRAIEFDVRDKAAAWYNIGLVHIARESSDDARAAFEMALEENPNFNLARIKLESL